MLCLAGLSATSCACASNYNVRFLGNSFSLFANRFSCLKVIARCTGEGQEPSTALQQPDAEPEEPPDEMEGIDPEFIAALPPDIQAEVLEQQRRERRRRQAEQQRAAAARVSPLLPVMLSANCISDTQTLHSGLARDQRPLAEQQQAAAARGMRLLMEYSCG